MSHNSITTFQSSWTSEFSWVKPSKKAGGYAECTLCVDDRPIFYASMGRAALSSHAKGKKHQRKASSATISAPLTIYTSSQYSNVDTSASTSTAATAAGQAATAAGQAAGSSSRRDGVITSELSQPSLSSKPLGTAAFNKFIVKEAVTKAEALWCLNSVMSHTSLRKSQDAVSLFPVMFPDSTIAADMKLGKDKISYSIVYSLAPYFKSLLKDSVKTCMFFVVGYDESLNKVAQKQQMDIILRFWDEDSDRVKARYYTSEFLERCQASDLVDGIKNGLSGLDLLKIIQFSMDGPNVNLKFKRTFTQETRAESDLPQLLDIGTCGLHVLNVAFKTGLKKTDWNLLQVLSASYYLFKDSPARRGKFKEITGSGEFPMKFCTVRWLENSGVAKREQEILPNLKTYVHSVLGTDSEPTFASFGIVREVLEDSLLSAKLAFFQAIAEDIEPFLRGFHSDAPLAPYLYSSLIKLLRKLMGKFVKPDVLNLTPLQKIDVMKKIGDKYVNVLDAKDVDLGYAVRAALKKCKNISDLQLLRFRQDCRTCLMFMVAKLFERCPLKYPLTKALTFLDPEQVILAGDAVTQRLTSALEIVMEANLFPPSVIQNADREYRDLLSRPQVLAKMKSYTREERLDDFWVSVCGENNPNLLGVIKCLLILSHENATLERGFSINKDILVENLTEESLRAQRIIFDAVQDAGGILKMDISTKVVLSMRNANARWKEALEQKKKIAEAKDQATALRRKSAIIAEELQLKKKKILEQSERQIQVLDKEIKRLKKH